MQDSITYFLWILLTWIIVDTLLFLLPPVHSFVFLHDRALPVCGECGIDRGFLVTAGFPGPPSRLSSAGFSLEESAGSRSPGGTGRRPARSSLLSFDCRPAAEPEGAHHFPRCGARAGAHPLGAVGQ